MTAATRFELPPELSATEPPEARGAARDDVRLLVARPTGSIRHRRFRDLPTALVPGDLVVVNTSPTAPAAVDALRGDGRGVTVHISGPVPGGPEEFVVELRSPGGERVSDGRAGEQIELPGNGSVVLRGGHPDEAVRAGSRLWRARFDIGADLMGWLHRHGRPISYSYLRRHWPLSAFQTIFARPGTADGHPFPSAEMPSAARPFTHPVLAALAARGVGVAEIVLHTGVSSLEADEVPLPERYRVPPATADAVNATRAAGGRVVAVGTTVTRALETVAAADRTVRAGAGWTDLVLGPDRPARIVGGLITGWHEPQASHLLLLEAVAGGELVARAYAAALAERYRWHEFGDTCLLFGPDRLLPATTTTDRIR
ncbi:S-adenosylmethionine:tRNA ribosyltransferase-isomerase [Pseudonocardia asaccharolytica]|uniref:Queuosine biosynthesis protein n=1 Tax=Pseudonocardia asaccharolytica DSM 44247 = NBRC 16224 TaxID=1123024 RepID=A0A511D1H8_9PSEU|nr:S-adenosylmethionine:tRNA ribosyltransferase-isomerase [Pseudonocardia asaccharolytica]GEL18640.1 queuosine biosynthesis protein [Pseudonocardia asaccharolytica DSM 44247 = NBRC 16224]